MLNTSNCVMQQMPANKLFENGGSLLLIVELIKYQGIYF